MKHFLYMCFLSHHTIFLFSLVFSWIELCHEMGIFTKYPFCSWSRNPQAATIQELALLYSSNHDRRIKQKQSINSHSKCHTKASNLGSKENAEKNSFTSPLKQHLGRSIHLFDAKLQTRCLLTSSPFTQTRIKLP